MGEGNEELKSTSPGESASETKILDYPSMEGLQKPAEKKVLQEKKEGDEYQLRYPSLEEGASGQIKLEGPPGLKTEEHVENQEYDLKAEDPEMSEFENALALFENEKYHALADVVERELTALQAGPEEIALFGYVKKHATDSAEWRGWIKKAVQNLYQHKRAARLHGQD